MGPRFLIDSNTIIDFLIGNLPPEGVQWLIKKVNLEEHCVSPIVQIEVLGYNGAVNEIRKAEAFINGSRSIAIDEKIIASAILIRRQKRIKLPDAIIAATALVHGLKIVSRNEKDFKGLEGVEVINLHNL